MNLWRCLHPRCNSHSYPSQSSGRRGLDPALFLWHDPANMSDTPTETPKASASESPNATPNSAGIDALGISIAGSLWRGGVVVGLTGVTVLACLFLTPEADVSKAYVNMALPQSIGLFWGQEQDVSEAEKLILPPDTRFAKKNYSDGLGNEINCQVVLAGAEKRSIHRPEVCLPGQGWRIKSTSTLPVKLSNGQRLDMTKLIIGRPVTLRDGTSRELTSVFCYWFIGKGITTPSHLERILRTNLDMLLHNINHRWAYTIVSAPVLEGFVSGGRSEAETLATVKEFVAELSPRLMRDTPAENPDAEGILIERPASTKSTGE